MIRVWNVHRLVDELRAGEVRERDKLHYVLATTALHYLVGPASLLSSPSWSTLGWNAVAIAIAFLGLTFAFSANGGEGGQSFIERYLCLSLPLIVRLYLVGYIVYYGVNIVVFALWPGYQTQVSIQRLIAVLYGVILVVVYFASLCRAMQRVAAPRAA